MYYSVLLQNTEMMNKDRRQDIRGKILKFTIECQPPISTIYDDILRDPVKSCLLFKVIGNYTGKFDM